ncbi:hypothetical protein SGLAM104S_02452 [Streptomyces glaucescens]
MQHVFWRWVIALAVITPFGARQAWRQRQLIRRHLGFVVLASLLGVTGGGGAGGPSGRHQDRDVDPARPARQDGAMVRTHTARPAAGGGPPVSGPRAAVPRTGSIAVGLYDLDDDRRQAGPRPA